jgi:hypothetical protein
MATQLLIYETAVPVSKTRHAKCCVEAGKGFAFTGKLNSVPLTAVEFPQAAPDYAVVFAQSGDDVMPVAILGARKDQNLYLTEDGGWRAKYIPAFIRRYPFVFSPRADGQTSTLCVDESYQGVNFQGRGQALFSDDGTQTPYVDNVLKFLQEYGAQFLRTQSFCKKLKELDLLESMQAQFTLGTGEKMSLSGFHVVSRERLKALPAETLHQLAATNELELIYLHLQSMRNFTELKDRLIAIAGVDKDGGAKDADANTAATADDVIAAQVDVAEQVDVAAEPKKRRRRGDVGNANVNTAATAEDAIAAQLADAAAAPKKRRRRGDVAIADADKTTTAVDAVAAQVDTATVPKSGGRSAG